MDEAWKFVWSNYSLSAFHAAVPSWQLMLRCAVFVLQGFYRNTVPVNGAGMGFSWIWYEQFLEIWKCTMDVTNSAHLSFHNLFLHCCSYMCEQGPHKRSKYGQSAQVTLCLLFLYSILQCCNCELTLQHTLNMHHSLQKQ